MKKTLLLTSLLLTVFIFSNAQDPKLYQTKYTLEPQGLTYYRLPDNFKFSNSYAKERYMKLENLLNTYMGFVKLDTAINGFTYTNSDNYYINAETYISMAMIADKNINRDVYNDELKWYKKYNSDKLSRYKEIKDSLSLVAQTKRKEEKRIEDSIQSATSPKQRDKEQSSNFYADKSNPYGKLENNLNGISYDYGLRSFTTFRGLDINFCSMRFDGYLQSDFGLAYKNSSQTPTSRTTRFVPKVSNGNEYILVKYNFQNQKNILGYIQTEDSTYDIVTSVEITGTKNLIIDLFLNFWQPLKTKIGGYKIGEIASKEFYSDRVLLIGLSSSAAKISIQKGNMSMNYYKTFGINAPKNSK
jgi:hypothetical protein